MVENGARTTLDRKDAPDPMRLYWVDLSAQQKRFVEARAFVKSDREACRQSGVPHDTVMKWKKETRFHAVHDWVIKSSDDMSRVLMQHRSALVGGLALGVLETYLRETDPSKGATDQARLAFDLVKHIGRFSPPQANGDEPLTLNVTELTREAQRKLPPEEPDAEEEDDGD